VPANISGPIEGNIAHASGWMPALLNDAEAATSRRAAPWWRMPNWSVMPAVDVGRAPVPLHLGHDHLVALGEPGQERAEVAGGHVGAVQQHERPARPVDLVVHLQIAGRRVAGAGLRVRHALNIAREPSRPRSRG
jgi:hypothetical protein